MPSHLDGGFSPQGRGLFAMSHALDPLGKTLNCAGKSLGDGFHLQALADTSLDTPVQLQTQKGDGPYGSGGTEGYDAGLFEIEPLMSPPVGGPSWQG